MAKSKVGLLTLQTDVSALSGVGPAVKEKLAKANINKVGDFLFILPNKYQDKTKITEVAALNFGEPAQVLVYVNSANITYGRQRMLVINANDDSGCLIIRLFNFSQAQLKSLPTGTRLLVYGQAQTSKGQWAMMHPEYKVLRELETVRLENKLSPVYPTLSGIGSNKIRGWVATALDCLQTEAITDFPPEFLKQYKLSSLSDALKNIHQPDIGVTVEGILNPSNPDLSRVVLDELLAKQIAMLQKKTLMQDELAPCINVSDTLQAQFLSKLAFDLTHAQLRVVGEVFSDIQRDTPMHRLVQGDVGSGKTVVAFSACLQAINQNLQAVLMAPTEILAEQHYHQAQHLLSSMEINVVWLSGKTKVKARREALAQIADGQAQLIIGTHALFQSEVYYNQLGLVVIDEQHRFGVYQRLLLRKKASHTGRMPHLLVMTATPIPRTLAMSFYADLDTSVINELPPNRIPVETVLLTENRRGELTQRIEKICQAGQQVYWVCALIEESEALEAQAAEDLYQSLQAQLPDLKIALLHGKQKPQDKETIIADFSQGKTQVLVATTVIEVGVDVPNASLMVIENAERFGLAQLHQLRGRVGRGEVKSYCVLLYKSPLSQVAKKRLQVIRHNNDGFEIAKEDLKIRGAGEVLGTRQTGEMLFRIADIERDAVLLEQAYRLAHELMQKQPQMADEIITRWLGNAQTYLNV